MDAEKALVDLEACCPCIRAMSGLKVEEFAASPCWRLRQKICRCGAREPDKKHIDCLWEGHAAARTLARAAFEAAIDAAALTIRQYADGNPYSMDRASAMHHAADLVVTMTMRPKWLTETSR